MVLVLSMVLGAGLIVHVALKDHWGRPRPRKTIELGGTQPFRPYYEPNFQEKIPSKSFPCGHCSTGFYFFSLAILGLQRKSKGLFYLGMFLALSLGTILGVTRIAQGAHFFSDVLVSALIMWLVPLFLVRLFFPETSKQKVGA